MANSRIASLELKDVNEPLDSYIERISQSIPQREVRTQYRKVFCVDNLRECLTQGKDMIQWECPVYAAKGISLRMIRTTVEMVRNVSYDRLEALIYFSDITENYFSEKIPQMLYRQNHILRCIIQRWKSVFQRTAYHCRNQFIHICVFGTLCHNKLSIS